MIRNVVLTEWPKDNSTLALESPVIFVAGGGGGRGASAAPAIHHPNPPLLHTTPGVTVASQKLSDI